MIREGEAPTEAKCPAHEGSLDELEALTKTKSGRYTISLIRGDGVGPEISEASLLVLDAVQEKFDIELSVLDSPAGDSCKEKKGVPLPESSLETIRASDACLKAPVGVTAADVIVRLRQLLDTYANIRPPQSRTNDPSITRGPDMVLSR